MPPTVGRTRVPSLINLIVLVEQPTVEKRYIFHCKWSGRSACYARHTFVIIFFGYLAAKTLLLCHVSFCFVLTLPSNASYLTHPNRTRNKMRHITRSWNISYHHDRALQWPVQIYLLTLHSPLHKRNIPLAIYFVTHIVKFPIESFLFLYMKTNNRN